MTFCALTGIIGIREQMQVRPFDDSHNRRQHRHAHQDAHADLSRPLHLQLPECRNGDNRQYEICKRCVCTEPV